MKKAYESCLITKGNEALSTVDTRVINSLKHGAYTAVLYSRRIEFAAIRAVNRCRIRAG
jgi:hypothetical protein